MNEPAEGRKIPQKGGGGHFRTERKNKFASDASHSGKEGEIRGRSRPFSERHERRRFNGKISTTKLGGGGATHGLEPVKGKKRRSLEKNRPAWGVIERILIRAESNYAFLFLLR